LLQSIKGFDFRGRGEGHILTIILNTLTTPTGSRRRCKHTPKYDVLIHYQDCTHS